MIFQRFASDIPSTREYSRIFSNIPQWELPKTKIDEVQRTDVIFPIMCAYQLTIPHIDCLLLSVPVILQKYSLGSQNIPKYSPGGNIPSVQNFRFGKNQSVSHRSHYLPRSKFMFLSPEGECRERNLVYETLGF